MNMVTNGEFVIVFNGIRQCRYFDLSVSSLSTIHGDIGVLG
jgi:hypothetical protein